MLKTAGDVTVTYTISVIINDLQIMGQSQIYSMKIL